MKKKIITFILFTTLLLIFSCSKSGMNGKSEAYLNERVYNDSAVSVEREGAVFNRDMSNLYGRERSEDAASPTANVSNVERKLVKRADIRIRVENLETADASVSDLMKKYSAYAASTEIDENAYRYSLRVPSPAYDVFLGEIDDIGRILRRSENTEDVTLRYYDLESRLATKRELLKTYQSYLGKANNIEEILSIEARIADLQNDIERTGTQFRNLANLVDYATIDVNLLGPAASTKYQGTTFGERIKELFSGFGGFLSIMVVVIIGIIIYGIPILLIVVFFVWVLFGRIGIIKRLWRKVTSKKQGE